MMRIQHLNSNTNVLDIIFHFSSKMYREIAQKNLASLKEFHEMLCVAAQTQLIDPHFLDDLVENSW